MKIDHGMSNIKNKANMIKEKMHKAREMDNDTLHLTDDNLNKIIIYLKRGLKKSEKRLQVRMDHLSNTSKKR